MVATNFFQPGRCFLFGMIHLEPLLEGPMTLAEVEARALEDASTLAEAGFNAVMIENFGDAPFYPDKVPPHTIAGMTRIGHTIQSHFNTLGDDAPKIGINVLRNDASAALAIAAAIDGAFIRVNIHSGVMVTDQGLIEGKAHETCRYRTQIHPTCNILADIHVKHAAPLVHRPLVQEAKELWQRAHADALILTGDRTGGSTDPTKVQNLRKALPDCPLLVGSGVTPDQLLHLLPWCNGLIVGTWLKKDSILSNPIDLERAKRLVELVRESEESTS